MNGWTGRRTNERADGQTGWECLSLSLSEGRAESVGRESFEMAACCHSYG